jgi:heme/copper-type cytochrome/quinol oxidase subunit 2
MNQIHLPRSLLILIFVVIAATFIFGTLRAFSSANAAASGTNLQSEGGNPALAPTITPGLTPTPPPSLLPAADSNIPNPTPGPIYIADTTGIIALVILLVFVMLVGMIWGVRGDRNGKEPQK